LQAKTTGQQAGQQWMLLHLVQGLASTNTPQQTASKFWWQCTTSADTT
jgi:hypothetical protein